MYEAKNIEEQAPQIGKKVSHFEDTIQSCKEVEKTLSNMQLPPDSSLVALHNEMLNPSDSIEKNSAEASEMLMQSNRLQEQVKDDMKYCKENIEKVNHFKIVYDEGQQVHQEYSSSQQKFQEAITPENFAQFIEATVKLDKYRTKLELFVGYKDVLEQMASYNDTITNFRDEWNNIKEDEKNTFIENVNKTIEKSNNLKKNLENSLLNYNSNPAKAAKDFKSFHNVLSDFKELDDNLENLKIKSTDQKIKNIIDILNNDGEQLSGNVLYETKTIASLLKNLSYYLKDKTR